MYTGIITVPKATLYEAPTKETVSDELLSGWTVTVEQECGNFLRVVTDYDYPGWLEKGTIRRISPGFLMRWNQTSKTVLLCRKTTDILRTPKVQAPVLSTLFMGSRVMLCDDAKATDNGWQKIRAANGICGYVPAVALLPPVCLKSGASNPTFNDFLLQNEWAIRSEVLNYAMLFLGTQYRWGGKTAMGIDCSGLTFMSYYMCGIIIYRDAKIKEGFPVHEIPFSQIKPADLLYFPGHVALYLGNEKYIHCTGNLQSFGCVINSLCPEDEDYRADLAESLLAVGSVF